MRTFEQMFDIISELGQGSPSRKTFDKYLLEPKEMSLTMFRGLCKVTNLSPDTMMELILKHTDK